MARSFIMRAALAGACLGGSSAGAAQVFNKTFTTGPNGVTQFEAGPGNMVGAVSNGKLPITTIDNGTNSAYVPGKSGEPLGTTINGNQAFSGLFNFNWSGLNTNDSSDIAYEEVGFLGTAAPQTRQVMGSILRHWYVPASEATNDTKQGYYVGVDLAFGSVGVTDFGYKGGSAAFIGTTDPTATLKLAVGYDPTTQILTAELFDASGNPLYTNSSTILALYGSHPASYDVTGYPTELTDLAATYLGWSDYTGNGNDVTTTWNMNSLSYYNDATGAFTAAAGTVPEPASIGILGMAGALLLGRRQKN